MRTSLIQLSYDDKEPLEQRVDRVARLVTEQAGSDLVLLPELWPMGGFAYRGWAEQAQPLDGPVVEAMRKAAAEVGATVHMGSIVERGPDGKLYNTSLLLGPAGDVLATYRKIHLFGFGEGEPVLLGGGDSVVVHGNLGLATCYDLRFPEFFRALLDRGADVVLLVAAWPAKRVNHWRVLTQARAVENQSYVLACNTAGTHAGYEMGGGSLVVDPWGTVLAEAGTGEEVLVVDIEPATVAGVRESFPVLADRRL